MPIKVPVTQTGLEASIEAAAKSAGRKLKINLGTSAKSIEGLSQPLGRITGKADQFTKSMEAANARVLAFGASVGVLSAVTRGFQELVRTTIDVEKRLTAINSILGGTASQLDSFKKTIFDVAKNTEQSFGTVADAALELSRQGLKAEEVTKRLNDALILSRLSGLGASEAVAGLTAAINSFNREGVTSAEVLNKLSAAAVSAAVSERDLIEGIKRSGSVAIQAGVSLDELVGVITAVQTKTARGGAVIGNSFKTIFTRIQSLDKLKTMQNLGVQITDFNGDILSGTKLIENLAKSLSSVPDARRLQIAENLVGKFQVAPFLAILDDYNSKTSKAIEVTKISQNATTEAYERNKALNQTLSAAINSTVVSVQQLAETLGKIGVTDNLKGILTFFNNLVSGLQNLLDGDSLGSKFAKGIVAGIGNVLSGPGLAIFGAIIAKLTIDLAKFGVGSLTTFFGLNKAAKEQATLQGQIASTLLGNSDIQKRILTIENSTLSVEQKRAAQTKFFTTALNEQLAVMTRMQAIAAKVTPGVFAGTRGGKGRAAGGFIPNYNAVMGYGSERADISRGVGGAPSSAKPVAIPNFNFGGGQKGTMVANSSEYMVPNFAGTGGSAIFNQDMVTSMGLPSGAKKIGAAGGYIPNFAAVPTAFSELVRQRVPGAFKTGNFSSLAAQKELRLPFSSDAQMGKLYANSSLRTSFDKLSPTQKRNLKQQGRQRAVTAKGTDQLAKFGILYPDAIGQQKPVTLTIDKTPVRAIPVATDPPNKLYKEIRKSLVKSAKKYANSLGFVPDIIKDAKFGKAIDRNLNEGSIEAAYGTVFEAAFQGAMGTEQKSTTRWDLANPAAIETLMGMIKSNGMLQGIRPQLAGISSADFKNSLSPDNLASIKGKIKASTAKKASKGKNAAGGYIPSFAGPLQEAVARETAAGLPINQVRINQDASLRNGANPMGLAITNTRDEPTGAIPNFAKKASPNEASDAMGGMVGKMLAVQIGFSALSGVLGSFAGESKAVSTSLMLLNAAVSAALVAQTFGGFKNIGKNVGFAALGGGRLGFHSENMMNRGQATINRGFGANQLAGGGLAGRATMAKGTLQRGAGMAVGMAGPLVAASLAAVGIGAAFNSLTGKTAALGKSQERVADSASKAASALSGLSADEDSKDKFVDATGESGESIAKSFLKGTLTSGAFSEGKEFENLSTAIDTALKRGASEESIQSKLDALKESTGTDFFNMKLSLEDGFEAGFNEITTLDSKDLSELSKTISRLGEGDIGGRFKEITEGLTEEQRKGLIAGDESTIKQVTAQTGQGGKKALSEDTIKLLAADLKATEAQRNKTKEKEKQKAIDQVNTSLAQTELKTQINLIKLKAEAISKDQITLKRNEFLNNLSEVQKQQIEQRIALKGIENETDGKIAEQITKQIDGMEKLTLDSEKQTELKEKLSGLSLEQLGSERKVKEILGDIFGLDGKITGEQDALLKGINKVTSGLKAEEALRKSNLKLSTDIGIADAGRAQALRTAIRGAERGNREITGAAEFELGGKLLGIQVERGQLNPNLTPQARANAEKGFVAREGLINIEGAENKAVDETKQSILNLAKEIKDTKLQAQFEGLLEVLQLFGPDALTAVRETLSTIAEEVFIKGEKSGRIPRPDSIFITEDQQSDLKDAAGLVKQKERDIDATKRQAGANNELAEAQARVADGFKSYTILLRDFTISLRQQAEQLKIDLVKARDGGSILSNVNEQLFTRQARGGGAGNIANAATNAAITGLQDQAFLAGSARESRGFTRQVDIVREQLQLKEEFVKLQEDEVVNEPKLIALKQRILQLEKERLQVNETLGAKFEDEFIKSDREIQNEFNDSLVSSARQFSTTLSEGLTNAIAKGESLGDTLKQAAANFFLEQSKNNFNTALSKGLQIFGFNAGGKVAGGSGARDDVPALLTGGEFVMNRKAVDKYGSAFMSSLNQGSIPTMNKGGLFTPGTFGQGAMKGKRNLLDFATQSFTTGKFDKVSGGSGFASIGLEPQSAALTMFGRRNSPQFQREQASKQQAFGLYKSQISKEKEFKESQTSLGDALLGAVKTFAISAAVKGLASRAANAASFGKVGKDGIARAMPLNEDGTEMGFLQRMMLPLPEKKATGGSIPYAAGVDTVPAMLSGGEFVMNAAATQRVGRGTLSSINSGGGAGNNGAVVGKLDELISVSENSGETTINITVNSDGTSDQSGNGNDQESNLALKIRDVVRQVIDDEKRLGGSLRQARA
jgi:TP901 family phage tail tape measure protein